MAILRRKIVCFVMILAMALPVFLPASVMAAETETAVQKNGIAPNEEGELWLYSDGEVDTGYNGIAVYQSKFYYVENGKVRNDKRNLENVNGKFNLYDSDGSLIVYQNRNMLAAEATGSEYDGIVNDGNYFPSPTEVWDVANKGKSLVHPKTGNSFGLWMADMIVWHYEMGQPCYRIKETKTFAKTLGGEVLYNARPGDLLYFQTYSSHYNNRKLYRYGWDHAAIIVDVGEDYITTVDGNGSDKVNMWTYATYNYAYRGHSGFGNTWVVNMFGDDDARRYAFVAQALSDRSDCLADLEAGRKGINAWVETSSYGDSSNDTKCNYYFGMVGYPWCQMYLSYCMLHAGYEVISEEEQEYAAVYDYYTYLSLHPEYAGKYATDRKGALDHFLKEGMKKGEQASESFDPQAFKEKYPELQKAFGDDWTAYYNYYVQYGNPGWTRSEEGAWSYRLADGSLVTDAWKKVNDKWYHFDEAGIMQTGWLAVDNDWYYLGETGEMLTGLQEIGENRYYFNEKGKMQTGWQEIDGERYYFGATGLMSTAWLQDNGNWHHFGENGAMQTGWQNIFGNWYHFGDTGVMQIGWREIAGRWYHFDSNGVMQTGWQEIGGVWYYLNAGGSMQTNWKKIGTAWYYFGSTGMMRTAWSEIDGKWYYFNEKGMMQTGWREIGGKWYYFNPSGDMATEIWRTINGKTYYFKEDGSMASEEWVKGYWLNAEGAWVYPYRATWRENSRGRWYGDETGWFEKGKTVIIDGEEYVFDEEGYVQ